MKASAILLLICSLAMMASTFVESSPGPSPGPEPAPDVDVVPGSAKRVLIVYESGDMTEYPAAQAMQLRGALDEFLDDACSKDEDGEPEWRIWDKDTVTDHVSDVWREAMALPRESLPWVIAANGTTDKVYSGPLPETTEETIRVLSEILE